MPGETHLASAEAEAEHDLAFTPNTGSYTPHGGESPSGNGGDDMSMWAIERRRTPNQRTTLTYWNNLPH